MPTYISRDLAQYLMSKNSELPELEILNAFPYPIHIYDAKGTSAMVNRAFLDTFELSSPDTIVGLYNLLSDAMIYLAGIREYVERAFAGETIFIKDCKVPVEYIRKNHNIKRTDQKTMYQDITSFPLLDSKGRVKFVVVMMITQRLYNEKSEINRAKEYIQNHCEEKFSLKKVASAAGFSPAYFARIFHRSTGMTPHEYYMKTKIEKIKIRLLDSELSVAEAFASCGVEYNGHFASVFKKVTGMTPSQYRKNALSR